MGKANTGQVRHDFGPLTSLRSGGSIRWMSGGPINWLISWLLSWLRGEPLAAQIPVVR